MARWQNRKRQNKRGLTWPGALRDIYQGENKGQKLSYMSGLETSNPRTFLWFRSSIFCVPKIRPEGRSTKNLDWLGGKHKVVFIAILSVLGDYTGSPMGAEQSQKLWNQWGSWAAPKTQASFFFSQKFCGNVAGILRKNFVSMGVQGCLLFVISAMILVALQKQ